MPVSKSFTSFLQLTWEDFKFKKKSSHFTFVNPKLTAVQGAVLKLPHQGPQNLNHM